MASVTSVTICVIGVSKFSDFIGAILTICAIVGLTAARTRRLVPDLWSPIEIRRSRIRLLSTDIHGLDVSEDEILGGNRLPLETPKHRQLSGVGHGIRQGTLQKLIIGYPRFQLRVCKIGVELMKCGMKAVDLIIERVEPLGTEKTIMKHRPRVPYHPGHVPNELVWGAHLRASLEFPERRRRVAQSLLRAIGKSRQIMLKKTT